MNVEFDIDGADVLPETVLDELDGTDPRERNRMETILGIKRMRMKKVIERG